MGTQKKLQLKVGDLVNHILMDERWVGVIVEVRDFVLDSEKIKKVLVYILSPHMFSKWHSQSGEDNTSAQIGWVDYDFLKLIAEGNIE